VSDDQTGPTKIHRPHAHFESPHEVVVDPELSKAQKIEVLNSLEQDARQLAIASSEGMSDGEATGLQDVLHAKEVLNLPPTSIAYEVVLQDLHLRLTTTESTDFKVNIQQAILALRTIQKVEQKV
jgi:hypothetical protein